MILANQLISAVLQLLILTAIPWIWFVVRGRRFAGFFQWIGLKPAIRMPGKEVAAVFVGFVLVTLLPYWYLYRTGSLTYSGFTVDSYRQSGWSVQTILVILIWAVLQTALSEEIFFRGFLCKRFCAVLGWRAGTTIQAAIFGAIHLPSVWGKGVLPALVLFLLTGGIGFALGWLSQRRAEGSILYGWLIHAAANLLSTVVVFCFLL